MHQWHSLRFGAKGIAEGMGKTLTKSGHGKRCTIPRHAFGWRLFLVFLHSRYSLLLLLHSPSYKKASRHRPVFAAKKFTLYRDGAGKERAAAAVVFFFFFPPTPRYCCCCCCSVFVEEQVRSLVRWRQRPVR